MSAGVVAAVLLAGGAGALLRYGISVLFAPGPGRLSRLPLAVLIVNVLGSALCGALLGLGGALDAELRLVLVTGFAGGLTTFSTFSVETVQLVLEGRARTAVASVAANLVLGVGAAAIAYAITAG